MNKLMHYVQILQICFTGASIYLFLLCCYLGESVGFSALTLAVNLYGTWFKNPLFHELLEKWGLKK